MTTITKRTNTRWEVSAEIDSALRARIEAQAALSAGSDNPLPALKARFREAGIAEAHAERLRSHLQASGVDKPRVRVQKVESTSWQVRVRRKGAAALTKTFRLKADAEQWAREREGEIAKREVIDYASADRMTLDDLLRRYEETTLSDKPRDHPDVVRTRGLRAYVFADGPRRGQSLASIAMSTLQTVDMAAYRDERLKLVKGATVRKELELMSRVINLAVAEWGLHLPANVASGRMVKRPKPAPGDERDRRLNPRRAVTVAANPGPNRRVKDPDAALEFDPRHAWILAIPVAEELAMLRACRYPHWFTQRKVSVGKSTRHYRANQQADAPRKARLRDEMRLWALVSLALETGLRRGEILKLEWSHVNLEKGRLILPPHITKNGHSRLVPLTLRAWRILATQPRVGDRVFDLKPSRVSSAWERARERVGSTDLRFHDLRHEATSRMFESSTMRAEEIGMITGHEDPRMLRRYYNIRADEFVQRFHASIREPLRNVESG